MWELVARESIRDLVARYNANGDSGRFDQVMELFAPDAVMEIEGEAPKVGHDEIRTIFTGAAGRADWGDRPVYLRHVTGTHQIDLIDESPRRRALLLLRAHRDRARPLGSLRRRVPRGRRAAGGSPGGGCRPTAAAPTPCSRRSSSAVGTAADRYSHGHDESVLRSHRWRTAENSAGFLLPHLTPGQRVLDVGCGPGHDHRRPGPAGVPGRGARHRPVRGRRRRRGPRLPRGRRRTSTFAVGDVYSLDHDDASFDVVYAHQVLQHLSEPVTALREMKRVLRPGGLVAVRDSDYGAFVWTPVDPRLDRWMTIYHALTRQNAAEADAGRYLHRWVREAGFTDLVVSSTHVDLPGARRPGVVGRPLGRPRARQRVRPSGPRVRAHHPRRARRHRRRVPDWAADDDGLFVVLHGEVLARA